MKLEPWAGRYVTRRRAVLDLSLRAAALRSGLSVGTWQRIENGSDFEYASLVKAVQALDWSLDAADELLAGRDPEDTPPPGGAAAQVEEEPVGFAALDGQPLTPAERAAAEAVVRAMRSSSE